MILSKNDFLIKLENLSYLHFSIYQKGIILFITLYEEEGLARYVIMESLSDEEYYTLMLALEKNK
jgi:hypothetical protein